MGGRQRAWERARHERGMHLRRYILNGVVCLAVAVICLSGLIQRHGLDKFVSHHIGPLWWDLLILMLTWGWGWLSVSYFLAALSNQNAPPRWWIPWVH